MGQAGLLGPELLLEAGMKRAHIPSMSCLRPAATLVPYVSAPYMALGEPWHILRILQIHTIWLWLWVS